jgi:phosphoribosyl 1,2-cyclic phosphodiesterase
MAMRMKILGSGSSGNCAVLHSEGTRILIDAGFTQRKLRQLLHDADESLEKIDAIFLTHEHGDHTAGIDGLKKFPHIKVFANAPTAAAVQSKLDFRPDWQLFQTGSRFVFRDLEVDTFHVPHDAQEPVGFTFSHGHEDDLFVPRRRVAWLTDLGHVPAHIPDRIRDVDVLVIEANHCPQMLEADMRRPWSTKQRISGRHGHLSNQRVCDLLAAITNPRWRHIYFTHLSRDCNSEAAIEAVLAPLRARLTCQFSIVSAGGGSDLLEF